MSDSDSNEQFGKKVIKTNELIEMVREQKCLWDRHYPGYMDRCMKDAAWNKIYTEFEPNFGSMDEEQRNEIGRYITRKWYNIRDSYVKSRKSLRPRNRPYLYAEAMKFLDSTILRDRRPMKKTSKTFIDERISHGEEEHEVEEPITWINEDFNDTGHDVDTSELPSKQLKLEYNSDSKDTTELNETIVQVIANLIEKEEDEDRAFFKSITPAVKKLSEDSKYQFRIQVMKLLNSLKMRDMGKTVTLKRETMSNLESESE